jgi:hypothetical protein
VSRAPRPMGFDAHGLAGRDGAVQSAGRVLVGAEQLEAVLGGVARAGRDDAHAGDDALGQRERAQRGDGRVGLCVLEHLRGLGALEGQERGLVRDVGEAQLALLDPGLGVGPEVARDLLAVRGVHHDHEALATTPIDDEVVEDRSIRLARDGVERLAVRQLREIARDERVDELLRGLPLDLHLAHVRDVEQARGRAHRRVLLEQARVLHGQLPSRERDDAAPEGLVSVVERRAAECFGRHGARS